MNTRGGSVHQKKSEVATAAWVTSAVIFELHMFDSDSPVSWWAGCAWRAVQR